MNIEIICTKCNKELVVEEIVDAPLHVVSFRVKPCNNCLVDVDVDCSKCEDLKVWLKRTEEAEEKLKNIQMFLDGGHPIDVVIMDDSQKPAQPNKFESHEPVEPELDTNIKNLQPTPDIVSTGGAIVPGIKKGSAEGVKAEYGKRKL